MQLNIPAKMKVIANSSAVTVVVLFCHMLTSYVGDAKPMFGTCEYHYNVFWIFN